MTALAASGGALAPELPHATGVGLEYPRIVGRFNPYFSPFFAKSDVSDVRCEI